MVWKLGNPVHLFEVSGSSQAADLHNECYGGVQPPTEKGNEMQDGISVRWQSVENAVSGNHGHNQKVDRPSSGLGTDSFPGWNLFWKTAGKSIVLRRAFITGLIDMQKNPCIIQVWAKPKNRLCPLETINLFKRKYFIIMWLSEMVTYGAVL